MGQIPYNSYHGRKHRLRSVLLGAVTALVILLAAVLAGYYLGFFNLPDAPGTSGTPVPAPTQDADPAQTPVPSEDPVVVIEPSASPSPTPAAADLSDRVIRDIPLGLVLVTPDALPEAGKNGVLMDMTGADVSALASDLSEKLAAQPYAAAWLAPDWAGAIGDDEAQQALIQRCVTLAELGFDEIVLSEYAPQGGGQPLADFYGHLKAELNNVHWQGRLGLAVDQSIFDSQQNASLISAAATCFERLYFRSTLKSANKTALTDNGFVANGYTLVTVIKTPADLGYAWAILP